MLPPFTLPSRPEVKITLREATVAEVIDFAGVNVGQEEEVTSLFLNRVQDKASFVDSRTWTAEDRRYALLWYFANTPGDKDVPISYDCQFCQERHHFLQDMRQLMEKTYIPIQGLPEREFQWGGETVLVKPVDGYGMEELEELKLVMDDLAKEHGEDSGEYQKQAARLRLTRFELAITFVEPESWGERIKAKLRGSKQEQEAEARAHAEAVRKAKRKKLTAMPFGAFEEFAAQVMAKLAEMEHGPESAYQDGKVYLITPPHQCPKNPTKEEATTRIRVTFRNSDYVPRLQ